MTACILLVDDEPRNLSLLDAFLAGQGYRLVEATGGREALARLDRGGIDLVLLDVMMPDLDGLDVLTHIRARETRPPHLPVVLVTAHGHRDLRLRALEMGADDFLEKPVDPVELRARVSNLLRVEQQAVELARLTDELAARNRELLAERQRVETLNACIVHDIRGALAVVSANLQYVVHEQKRGEDLLAAVLDAQFAADNVLGVTTDMLEVTRWEQDAPRLERRPLDLRPLVDDVFRSARAIARMRSVELLLRAPEHAPLVADERLVRRAVWNLVDNALRYTLVGGRVELAVERRGDEMVLEVRNSGSPIPEQVRGRLFEKFLRADEERAGVGGFGIGLYFCRYVTEAHEGRIEVDESVDWPVVFRVSLPIR